MKEKLNIILIIIFFYFNTNAHIIDLVEGEAEIIRPTGEKIKAVEEMRINEKDVIMTFEDAFVNIILNDKSEITIEENTKIKLEKYIEENNKRQIQIKLDKGMIKCLIKKDEQQIPKEFKLSTPVAVVGVRGTEFITNQNDEDNEGEIDVFSGEVEISNIEKPEEKFILKKGESIRITKIREFIKERISEFKENRLKIFQLRKEILKEQKKKMRLKLELLKIKNNDKEAKNAIIKEIDEIDKNQKEKIKQLIELRKEIIKKRIKNIKERIKNRLNKEE